MRFAFGGGGAPTETALREAHAAVQHGTGGIWKASETPPLFPLNLREEGGADTAALSPCWGEPFWFPRGVDFAGEGRLRP